MTIDNTYRQWLLDLKQRIRQSQIKAAIKVNTELLRLYWDLGHDIVVRQMESTWGSRFFDRLSQDLRREFPEMKGFSSTNLKYCKRFYLLYSQDETICPQIAAEFPEQVVKRTEAPENESDIIRHQLGDEFEGYPIFQTPWRHHIEIMTKCSSVQEALFYVQKTIQNGWSRAVLMNFLESNLYLAQGKSINNFSRLLPAPQSDLAKELLKNPYNFDFLILAENFKEKELEDSLIANITKLLLELGRGFAYLGRQVPVKIGTRERFIDLLFYHTELHCYVVVELKVGEFEAEYIGKLGLYISAINHQRKTEIDNPTIGLLICKTKDNVEAQYTLEIINQPIGISEYQLSNILPENYKSALPSIEAIEKGLKNNEVINK